MKYNPDSVQKERLELLKTVISIFEENIVKYSVAGGYGLDGLYGELTRDHEDIDVIVDSDDIEKARALLLTLGFKRKEDALNPTEVYFHNVLNVKLELGNLTKFPEHRFEGDTAMLLPGILNASLDGVSFKAVTLAGHKAIRIVQEKRHGKEDRKPKFEHDESLIAALDKKSN